MTDIGATLREARMRRRIDITEVEQATKIRARYLRAMEDEEWELLPGPTFVKSFLRTYADYLGLDSRLLIEEWKRSNERVSEQDLAPMAPRGGRGAARDRPREPARWRNPALVVGVLVVLLGGLYLLGRGSNSNNSKPLPAPRGGGGTGTTKKPAAAHPRRPARVRLSLTATAPVYVCLVNGAGKRLLNGVTLQPGSGARVFTARRFLLNLGNSSVTLRANGKPVPVAASGTPIGLDVTPGGHRPLAAGRRPTCA